MEIWKPAVSTRFPEYVSKIEVSNLGRLRTKQSIDNEDNHYLIYKLRNKNGYLCIKKRVSKDKTEKHLFVHTLVAETFIGPRPPELVIDHIDADKNNNVITNLRYITNIENVKKGNKPLSELKIEDKLKALKECKLKIIDELKQFIAFIESI